MSDNHDASAEFLTPILHVRDFHEAVDYYTKKLLFELKWSWGQPPSFGCVGKGKTDIFFCLNGRRRPGARLQIFVVDVDEYLKRITQRGADVVYGPADEPWGMREVHVRDPNQHIIRFGHRLPKTEPTLQIDRVAGDTRIKKRLAALRRDLAAQKRRGLPLIA